ncbi:hypothetical protein BDW72DRAFT_182541, partial [Aspergillus terricola var. indicus]
MAKLPHPSHFSLFDDRGFEQECLVMICGGHQVPAVRRRSRFDRSAELVEILTARKVPWCFYR